MGDVGYIIGFLLFFIFFLGAVVGWNSKYFDDIEQAKKFKEDQNDKN